MSDDLSEGVFATRSAIDAAAAVSQVARSADWYAGEREPLAPALVLGGVR